MSEGYEEDLEMYEKACEMSHSQLDSDVLLRPISDLDYPKDPVCVGPGTSVGEALRVMSTREIGALPVVEGGKIAGIFAERDVLSKGLYDGKQLEAPLSEFMTRNPVCLTPHDTIAFALNRMVVGGYRHIPLVDPAGQPEGILAMRDVMSYVVSFFPTEVLSVPPHSEHNPPERELDGG
ncbi:MAG: cyclic nucleotide-binding/CBS domain-containing protein [Planctomycetota bacterium]